MMNSRERLACVAPGADRLREYVVWDPCCGVGNLETKHSNPRNVFMSTLDQPDVDVMKAAKTCRAATRFQYDYLNDDIADDGSIDYSITNKMPQELRSLLLAAKDAKNAKLLSLLGEEEKRSLGDSLIISPNLPDSQTPRSESNTPVATPNPGNPVNPVGKDSAPSAPLRLCVENTPSPESLAAPPPPQKQCFAL